MPVHHACPHSPACCDSLMPSQCPTIPQPLPRPAKREEGATWQLLTLGPKVTSLARHSSTVLYRALTRSAKFREVAC